MKTVYSPPGSVDIFGGDYPEQVASLFAAALRKLGGVVTFTQDDFDAVAGMDLCPVEGPNGELMISLEMPDEAMN